MRRLHLEKRGIKGLAVAESFEPNQAASALAGVVMRGDFVIEGFAFGRAAVRGTDATDAVLEMWDSLERDDISYVLLSGLIISMYNVIDPSRLYKKFAVPIISITRGGSDGLDGAAIGRLGEEALSVYRSMPERIHVGHGKYDIRAQCLGCSPLEAKHLIKKLTLDGSMPEPLRVAKILARRLSKSGF